MPEFEARPLHLHTLESLLADLVSGRPVKTGDGDLFALSNDRARSALEWYRRRGKAGWSANVTTPIAEELVDTILQKPPDLKDVTSTSGSSNRRRLRLKKMEAHRFAGLHKFGTPAAPPDRFVFEFKNSLTLFEGRNGSGKTSLLNAIVWALTGELLRPQREPESAGDFECSFPPEQSGAELTTHKVSAVTPLPHASQYRPESAIPADTWVELTFEDESGALLPPFRRSQSRGRQGKLHETSPDFSPLQVDPIALRLGTVMPGLLSLIRVGTESELGRAVSQLTGLSALVDLADHVRRVKHRIKTDLVRAKNNELDQIDKEYRTAEVDLAAAATLVPEIKSRRVVPEPSEDEGIEAVLDDITSHYETAKAGAFESARQFLGEHFDPTKSELLADLERNIGRAIERAGRPQDLESAKRLGTIRFVTTEELDRVEQSVRDLLNEAATLKELAEDASLAARTRLYARIAAWIADHPEHAKNAEHVCLICGAEIGQATDPISGLLVTAHLQQAHTNAELLSQTITRWAISAQNTLLRALPEGLRAEAVRPLPSHPVDLLRSALVDELFAYEPFLGVLSSLKEQTAARFDQAVADRSPLSDPMNVTLPDGCEALKETLRQLDLTIRFARWRQGNEALVRQILSDVLGKELKDGGPIGKRSLLGNLSELDGVVRASKPVSDALKQCGRLKQSLSKRRKGELRLKAYSSADAALGQVAEIGRLADEQVDDLRKTLSEKAAFWRSKIYLGAFPGTAHELVDTPLGRNGELGLLVRVGGVSAPAEHVSNASALRASLVGFFFAFWEYLLGQRGGITTLLLDDPQELLDDENRERLADALADLVTGGAQLVVTSYASRFCARVSRLVIPGGTSHFGVHPATDMQQVVRLCEPLSEIEKRRKLFEADRNDEECARNFLDACRVFLEAKLGDMFDDPAHSAWAATNRDPTLVTFVQRLRPLVKAGKEGMFGQHVFGRFVDHPALADRSQVTSLMNKSHHGHRGEIRAADVDACTNELSELLEMTEQMYEECLRWRRRDRSEEDDTQIAIMPLPVIASPSPEVPIPIWTSLAAATGNDSAESQEPLDFLEPALLRNKSAFILRRHNFGFAAPMGSIALVEAVDGPVADRRLVIARTGDSVYARRLIRGTGSSIVGLTADVPDPRTRTPKTVMVPQNAVSLHQVVGIIFDHSLSVQPGQEEAVQVVASDVMKPVEVAFRIKDDSAVPLALENQIVLSGKSIELSSLNQHEGALVALALDDGSGLFKRVGSPLPGPLSHLRQFESIGGLGASQILAVGEETSGFRTVLQARRIIGVLYHG